MWETEYSDEADGFFEDNGELVAELLQSIESLRVTEGIPGIGAMEMAPGIFYWLTDDHIVVYQRVESQKLVRIVAIRPDDY